MEKIGNSLIIVFLVAGFFTSAYNIPSVVAPHDCTATKCASSGGTWATSPDNCSSMATTAMPTEAGTCNYPSPSPTTSYTCSDGPIPSSGCNCGSSGTSYSGYCCSNAWQSSACGTATTSPSSYPDCNVNTAISTTCRCGSSSTYSSGYCCSSSTAYNGWWTSSTCPSPTPTETCSSSQFYGCHTLAACTSSSVGGKWCASSNSYGGDCYSPRTACPTTTSPSPGASPYYEPATCSSTNPWNCYTQADCTDTAKGKGVWCKSSNSYGGNCNSAGTTCPICSSTQVWNCYTDTECKTAGGYWSLPTGGAGGTGWCSSSPNDKASCTTAGQNWCGTYCTSGTCPTCSSSQIWNCYEEPSCTTAGGVWCKSSNQAGGNCNTKPYTCPTCSSSQLWSCYDSASCTGAGGQWSNNYCEQKCSAANIWSCKDSASCTTAGGQWNTQYGNTGYGTGNCEQKCSSSNIWSCRDSASCISAGGQWSNSYCNQKCSTANLGSCTETECKTAGGQWSNTYCQQPCSSSNIWSCKDEPSCTGAGGQWNTQYGSGNCEQKCSTANIWSCKDSASCTTAGGQWQNSYCSQKCSAASIWTCADKTSCEGVKGVWTGTYCNTPQDQPGCIAAGLKWCTPQGGGGTGWCSSSCPAYDKASCEASNQYWCGSATVSPADSGISSGWCSQSKCPECNAFNIYNCYDRESCEKAKGYWYKSMCNSLPAPKCEKGKPLYQCYEKTPCESAGGEWCVGSQYGGYVSYTPGSQGYCTTKATPSLCPKTCPSVKACLIDEIAEFDNDGCQKACRKLSACPAVFAPVCGSDGKTYPNDCEAKAVGVTFTKGECKTYKVCDEKAYDDAQKCRESGQSYTFDEDKSGCPVPGTTKCTPFKHKCPIFATSAATVGFVSPRDGCITSGGEYKEEIDSFSCGHPKCDHDKTLSKCKYVKHAETASEVLECPDDYRYKEACPQFNQKELDFMKSECTKYGGTFATTVKGSCTYPDCKFTSGDFDFDNPLGKIEKCQTNLEIQKQSLACEALGGKALNSIVGGCKKLVCDREESKCTHEPALEQQTAELCKKEGKEVIKKFDSNGCTFSTCGKADECDKEAPATVAAKCASEGGEYVVNKAPNGCVEFADCIKPGLHADDVLFEPVKAVPDVIKLLDIALKLEELKIALDKLAVSAEDLSEYYESKGENGDAEKYKRVADMLESAKDEVDKIKEKLKAKLDKITIDELTEVKKDLAVLKDSLLREVLFLILSTKSEAEDVATTKVCGSNADCFDNAYRTCKPTTFTPPVSTGKSTPTVKIDGLQDDKCILTASLTDAGTSYSMNCAIENYALGMHGPEDLLPHCTGNMVDLLKSGYFDSKPAPEAPSTTKTPATGLIIRR